MGLFAGRMVLGLVGVRLHWKSALGRIMAGELLSGRFESTRDPIDKTLLLLLPC